MGWTGDLDNCSLSISLVRQALVWRGAKVTALAEIDSEAVGIKGPANVQCFRESDGMHYVTDINPRFGGGFPLPTAAGSHYPELALALARGERPAPRRGEFREGVVMTRFFSHLTLVETGGKLAPADRLEELRADRST